MTHSVLPRFHELADALWESHREVTAPRNKFTQPMTVKIREARTRKVPRCKKLPSENNESFRAQLIMEDRQRRRIYTQQTNTTSQTGRQTTHALQDVSSRFGTNSSLSMLGIDYKRWQFTKMLTKQPTAKLSIVRSKPYTRPSHPHPRLVAKS